MTNSTASVYHERGRVWLRAELSEKEYGQLLAALADRNRTLHKLIWTSERSRPDRSDIFDRFDDPETEMRRDSAR